MSVVLNFLALPGSTACEYACGRKNHSCGWFSRSDLGIERGRATMGSTVAQSPSSESYRSLGGKQGFVRDLETSGYTNRPGIRLCPLHYRVVACRKRELWRM
jgi:hypothetical protein